MENDITFDSYFESGNLDMVVKVSENEYDLYMKVDTNTRGHNQWFYFKTTNKNVKTVKFNIMNFTKSESLYNSGMRISIKSELCSKVYKKGWYKGGENIQYRLSRITQESMKSCSS